MPKQEDNKAARNIPLTVQQSENDMIEFTEEYDNLPKNIQVIIDSYNENKDEYFEASRIQEKLNSIGWSCDYYLDGVIFDIKKLKY